MKILLHKKAFYFLLLFSILIAFPFLKTSAQEDCGNITISDAKKKYMNGNFDEVLNLLYPCLDFGFDRKQKQEAHHILALTYLAIDSVNLAGVQVNKLIDLNPNFEPDLFDPPRFIKMIDSRKKSGAVQIVTSVSKKAENINEAPATIMVITREEIDRRGYLDLVALLKDIPGFDISMFFGPEYANIYQRGFRQNNTEKTLIMIDGIEDNDLWTNWAYISRQYSLTNIERVEVIYGPASTMYGPNAFAGVINIITRNPNEIGNKDKFFGASAQTGYGSYNTKYADLSIALRKNIVSFSVTSRVFFSDEMDISSQEVFNFDPSAFDTVNYNRRLDIISNAKEYIEQNNLPWDSPYYTITNDTSQIILTQEGVEKARELDKTAYEMIVDGEKVGFSNKTKTWYLNSKLCIGDFTLGFQTWKKNEGGLSQFTDAYATGITAWVPSLSFIYTKYENQLTDKINFSGLLSYKIHKVSEDTRLVAVSNYEGGAYGLSKLVNETAPAWNQIYLYEMSKQLRAEAKVVYNPSLRFDMIAGVEYRNSQLQGNYLVAVNNTFPQDSGVFNGQQEGGNQFNIDDIGVYAQGDYRFCKSFKLTVGARLDHNKIRRSGGYGTEISPRFALVYTPKNMIIKAVYSKGIQNVSNWTKYSTAGNRVPNPNLGTESIHNFELSFNRQFIPNMNFDVSVYYSKIDNVVGKIPYPENPSYVQNANIGVFNIYGLQSNITYKIKTFSAYLNYTYCKPEQTVDETGDVYNRVGDISSHQVNAGINKLFFKKLNLNLRMNYDSKRITGEGTTVPLNNCTFNGTTIFNAVIGYRKLLPGMTLQLICNNLFNKKYYDPGVKLADGYTNPSRTLQQDRNFMFRILYDF